MPLEIAARWAAAMFASVSCFVLWQQMKPRENGV